MKLILLATVVVFVATGFAFGQSAKKNDAIMQDGMCSGKTLPATVHASAVYVKRGGKWLVAFYTDTPATK